MRGAVFGQNQLYARYGAEKLAKVRPVLEDTAFGGIEAYRGCDSDVTLDGTVESETERGGYSTNCVLAVGDAEAEELLAGVRVKRKAGGAGN